MLKWLKDYFINRVNKVFADPIDCPAFVTYPWMKTFYYSNDEYPWRHPRGYPYQVFEGGPHLAEEDRFTKQVWTNASELEGYELGIDMHSDRPYHIWHGQAEGKW